jgi:hypothetical protein
MTATSPAAASSTRPATVVRVLVTVCSLLLVTLLVLAHSRAAFTATPENPGNEWATATVTLSDSQDGVAMFNVTDMMPGDVATASITVEYEGSAPSVDVRLYGADLGDSDGLAQHLNLRVSTTAANDGDIYDGDLADFAASHSGFGNGADNWDDAGPTDTRDYYFWVELDSAVPGNMQGTSAQIDFVWEAQTN